MCEFPFLFFCPTGLLEVFGLFILAGLCDLAVCCASGFESHSPVFVNLYACHWNLVVIGFAAFAATDDNLKLFSYNFNRECIFKKGDF